MVCLINSQSYTPASTTTERRLAIGISSTCQMRGLGTHMVDLYTSVDDIDVNATSSAFVVNVRVRQSEGIFRGHGFTLADSLQTPRRVSPNSDGNVNSGRSRYENEERSH